MSDIKWIKLSVNMFDDEKIKLIRTLPEGDSIVIIWVQILCLAGKINDNGMVYMGQNLAYSDEMLATILDHPVSTMQLALKTLESFSMIDRNDEEMLHIINWEKHQSTDKMARIKQQNRERQQRHYYRSKLRQLGVNVDEEGFTDDLEELKKLFEQSEEKPNVRLTLPNATEVRSKKKEVRGKKKESTSSATLKDRFEELWKEYPRKKGKKRAFDKYKKAVKEGHTDKEIAEGIANYNKEIKHKGTEIKFVKHGSVWFNNYSWQDEYEIGNQREMKEEANTNFDDLNDMLGG